MWEEQVLVLSRMVPGLTICDLEAARTGWRKVDGSGLCGRGLERDLPKDPKPRKLFEDWGSADPYYSTNQFFVVGGGVSLSKSDQIPHYTQRHRMNRSTF